MSHIVLEARGSKSGCLQAWFILRAPRKNLFPLSLLASGDYWQSLGLVGLDGPYHFCFHLYMAFSLYLCASHGHLFIRILVTLDLGFTLLQCDLVLTNYIYKPYFQIRLRSELVGFRTSYLFGETHSSIHNIYLGRLLLFGKSHFSLWNSVSREFKGKQFLIWPQKPHYFKRAI